TEATVEKLKAGKNGAINGCIDTCLTLLDHRGQFAALYSKHATQVNKLSDELSKDNTKTEQQKSQLLKQLADKQGLEREELKAQLDHNLDTTRNTQVQKYKEQGRVIVDQLNKKSQEQKN